MKNPIAAAVGAEESPGMENRTPKKFYFQICQVQPLGISVANILTSKYLFG